MIRKIFALTAFIATLFSSVYSQNINSLKQSKIDSIKNVVDSKKGLEAFEPLVALTVKQAETDHVTALETVTRANQLATQFGDSTKMVRSGRMMGQLLNKLGRHKEVIAVLTRYYPVAKRNNNHAEIPKILNNLAVAYTIQADYEKALDINFQTLMLREAENDKKEMSISLNNIGFVYFKLRNYSKALEFFDRALIIKRQSNDTYDLDRLYMNIGLCYNQLNDPKQAMMAFQEGFNLCGDKCSDETIIEGEFGLGMSYLSQKKYTVAKPHFNKSKALAVQVNNLRFVAENCITLARIYAEEAKRDSAFFFLRKSEAVAFKEGYNEILLQAYTQFAQLYKQVKDFENASKYQERYVTLKDSIIGENLIERLTKIQTLYEERENLKTIADKNEMIQRQRRLNLAQEEVLILKDNVIENQKMINIISATLIVVFICFLVLLGRTIQVKRHMNAILDKRFQERSREFNNERDGLIRELQAKNALLGHSSDEIQNILQVMQRLSFLASKELSDPLARNYFEQMEKNRIQLEKIATSSYPVKDPWVSINF